MKWAALFPVVLIGYGIVTSVPWLFNALGIALYAALLRECGRHIIPWPKVRRAMWLDKIDNPSPPPPKGAGENAKYLFTEDRPGHWAVTPNPSWRGD